MNKTQHTSKSVKFHGAQVHPLLRPTVRPATRQRCPPLWEPTMSRSQGYPRVPLGFLPQFDPRYSQVYAIQYQPIDLHLWSLHFWRLYIHLSGWWFGNVWNIFIFPYIGNNHPDWLSYFSEGVETTKQFVYVCVICLPHWLYLRYHRRSPFTSSFLCWPQQYLYADPTCLQKSW
jgi:hypothetical protein